MTEDVFHLVMTGRELAVLAQHPTNKHRRLATLVFSAKEAAFKSQFPLSGHYLDFLDAEVALDLGARSFRLGLDGELDHLAVHGRFDWSAGHVVTAARCELR